VPSWQMYSQDLALVGLVSNTPNLISEEQRPHSADADILLKLPVSKPSIPYLPYPTLPYLPYPTLPYLPYPTLPYPNQSIPGKDSVSFNHKSLYEYFAASGIKFFLQSGGEGYKVTPTMIGSDRGVLTFLREMTSLSDYQHWEELVRASRDGSASTADVAAVALTALCSLNCPLQRRDFSGVRVPYASLVGGHLRGTSMRGGDLRGVDLRAADLDDTDLDGARMNGVVLGRPPSLPPFPTKVTAVHCAMDLVAAACGKDVFLRPIHDYHGTKVTWLRGAAEVRSVCLSQVMFAPDYVRP
jgi:hypothetical protein